MRNKWGLFVKFAVISMSVFAIFGINSVNANASNINYLTEHKITSGRLSSSLTSGFVDGYVDSNYGISFSGNINNWNTGWITNLNLQVNTPIPANSVFWITGYYYMNSASTNNFKGLQTSPEFIILESQVTNISGNGSGSASDSGLQYSYLIYSKNAHNTILFGNNELFVFSTGYNLFTVSNIISAQLSTDPSSNQLDGVLQDLDDIKLQLQSIAQNSQNQAISEMNQRDEERQQQEEDDRDNIEQQSSDAQDGADDSQQQAESTGSTLLAAFTAFVNALSNASPSNCNIDMDLGNLDLGNVNLCQLSLPAGFQAISSIFMILFCVPLSIATARKVISLFRSFQT